MTPHIFATERELQRAALALLHKRLPPAAVIDKRHGGPMGTAGWPDVQVLYGGACVFIELKRPGEKPTPLQAAMHARLRAAGFRVFVVTTLAELEPALDAVLRKPAGGTAV